MWSARLIGYLNAEATISFYRRTGILEEVPGLLQSEITLTRLKSRPEPMALSSVIRKVDNSSLTGTRRLFATVVGLHPTLLNRSPVKRQNQSFQTASKLRKPRTLKLILQRKCKKARHARSSPFCIFRLLLTLLTCYFFFEWLKKSPIFAGLFCLFKNFSTRLTNIQGEQGFYSLTNYIGKRRLNV